MTEADPAAPSPPPEPPRPAPPAWRKRARRAAYGLVALALVLVLAEAGRVFIGSNFHTVIPGRVYRCCQPNGGDVERLVASHGIRTVVNLRGSCSPFPWYLDEARATARLGICQEDVSLSAGRLPATGEMRRLVEVLERSDYPLVLHCRRGADRTGLAAAVALLLLTDATPAQAARQLWPRYGHVALGRPAYLDQFLALYADWLRAQKLAHSPAVFRRWATREYRPAPCSAAVELLGPKPLRVRRGEPAAVRVRARNTSGRTWRFRPVLTAGVHLGFHVWDERDVQVAEDRAGLYDADVPPGGSIEVTLALPPLARAGRYRLMVDLSDERQCWFFQAGSEPLEEELEVCD